jgi:hypothetical protein
MLQGSYESRITSGLKRYVNKKYSGPALSALLEAGRAEDGTFDPTEVDADLSHGDLRTIVFQFHALGLISANGEDASPERAGIFWCLISYGQTRAVQLTAVRRA